MILIRNLKGLAAVLVMFAVAKAGNVPGSAYYNFLEEAVNPRAMAMGSAGTALGAGGFSFYNPASMALRSSPFISFEIGKIYEDLRRGYIETGWIFPKWFVGGSFQSQSVQFQYATEQGIVNSYGSQQSSSGTLNAGLKRGRFAIGAGFNGVYDRLAENSSYGFTLSGGMIYSLIPEMLDIGASYMHGYGRNSGYLDTTGTFYRHDLPSTARFGAAFRNSINGGYNYTISADLVYNRNYEKLTVPLGAEMWILPAMALRIGTQINDPANPFSAGVGIKWENLKIDASFATFRLKSDNSLKWSLGFTYELASVRKKEKEAAKVPSVEKTAPVQVESTETVPAVEPPSPPVDSEEAKSDGEPGISGSEVEEPAAVSSEDAPDSSGNSPEEGDRGIIGDNPESRIPEDGSTGGSE
ncbi:MAG TPA: hypothetical protein PLE24_01075 [Chitinispirillaceae bacterium]|jgi:hypothetical protein|nr:hypothetical protein [Chitinispirillaceae bacterium]